MPLYDFKCVKILLYPLKLGISTKKFVVLAREVEALVAEAQVAEAWVAEAWVSFFWHVGFFPSGQQTSAWQLQKGLADQTSAIRNSKTLVYRRSQITNILAVK